LAFLRGNVGTNCSGTGGWEEKQIPLRGMTDRKARTRKKGKYKKERQEQKRSFEGWSTRLFGESNLSWRLR
jgi:hypothetical protein